MGHSFGHVKNRLSNSASFYPLMALALAACGGSAPPPPPFVKRIFGPDPAPTEAETGRVFDGPVSGAQVYFDVNANGVQDDGDVLIDETDALGSYTISAELLAAYGDDTPLLVVLDGAIDIGDDLDDPSDDREIVSGTWQAPAGSRIISPLTDFLVRAELDPERDSARIAELLELPPDVDVTQYDPYESDTPDATALAVIEVAQEVAEVLADLDAADEEVTPDEIITVVERVVTSESPTAFRLNSVVTTLAEGADTSTRTKLADLAVTDVDTASAAQTYLLSGDDAALFEVDGAELFLIAGATLDFETNPSLDVTVKVVGAELTQTYTLTVTNVPSPPVITVVSDTQNTLNEGTIDTDTATGYVFTATDEDGDTVTFSVDDDRFAIGTDGNLNMVAGSAFDFETEATIDLTITATDDSTEALTDREAVTITLSDVLGDPENVVVAGTQNTLNEGLITAATDTGLTVTATDPDGNTVTFSVDDDRFEFINGALWVKAGSVFDYEDEANPSGAITLTITATDDSTNRLTTKQEMVFTVGDLIDFTYDGVASSNGRHFAVVLAGETEQTITTAHMTVPTEGVTNYLASDFIVYEGDTNTVSTRFDIIDAGDTANSETVGPANSGTFVLVLKAGNALPSTMTEPIDVRVEVAGGVVPTYFRVVTAENTLREYGLEEDPLTGTVMLPGATALNDITVTMGRGSYIHTFERSTSFGNLDLEVVDATTGEFRWTYTLDHNGPGLNNAGINGLTSEVFALSSGGMTEYVAVNVQTLWNSYLYAEGEWARYALTDENKDDSSKAFNGLAIFGSLGGADLLKGFGGDDDLFGYGGNDVLIGGTGRDRIHLGSANTGNKRDADGNLERDADGNPVPLGSDADGSSTVIYRFETVMSEGETTAMAADGFDSLTGFEPGIDRVMLIDTGETDAKVTDLDEFIDLAKTDAVYVKLISGQGKESRNQADYVWIGMDISFALDDTGTATADRVNTRTLRVSFDEVITDAEARGLFGDSTAAAGFYFIEPEGVQGEPLRTGALTDDGLDALGTFFGDDNLLVVDTTFDLDIF